MRGQRAPEDGRAADTFDKKRHQKQGQHHAIKNGADDVDGLDEVLRQMAAQRKGQRHQAPEQREPFRGPDIVVVGRVAPDQVPVKINRRGGTEGVEFGGFGGQGGGKERRHQQPDQPVRQLPG